MELLDRLLQDTTALPAVSRNEIISFEIQGVSDYYYYSTQEIWGYEDFPFATPCWRTSFLHWLEPDRMFRNGQWERSQFYGGTRPQMGCLVLHATSDDTLMHDVWSKLHGGVDLTRFRDDRTYAFIVPYCWTPTTNITQKMPFITRVTLTPDGMCESHTTSDMLGAEHMIANEEEIKRFGATMVHIMGLAFTFANCKNTTVDDAPRSPRDIKVRRRLRIPEVKRYTLNITKLLQPARLYDASSASGESRAFHVCRGHFATYTKERPLFGKYTGRFWIPPHTRGKKELGTIEKGYKVASH